MEELIFQTDDTLNRSLFAFTPRDLVAKDSDVWLYIDLFDNVDLLDFDSSYCPQGQAAKEPKLILRTIFYALTHGICSGRKLAEVCRNDNRFIVLSGNTRPDRRTFDRFIRRHEKSLDSFFVQIVRLAQHMGLVSLGRVAIDGSKFKAHANKHMRYDKMNRAIAHINNELKELKNSLKSANKEEATELSSKLSNDIAQKEKRIELIQKAKAQIEKESKESSIKEGSKRQRLPKAVKTLHDPDALSLGASAKFPFGYNAQAAVDADSQIIVAASLANSPNDSRSLPDLLDEIEENCEANPKKLLADNGYFSSSNLKDTKDHGSVPYISRGREYVENKDHAIEQVKKDKKDNYLCMQGKVLTVKTKNAETIVFAFKENFCKGCPLQTQCRLYGKKTSQMPAGETGKYLKQYYKRTKTPVFKDIYRYRKAIVEPVFGNIKNKGIKLYYRGKQKVYTWWRMACTAHNIEKLIIRT